MQPPRLTSVRRFAPVLVLLLAPGLAAAAGNTCTVNPGPSHGQLLALSIALVQAAGAAILLHFWWRHQKRQAQATGAQPLGA